MTAWHHRRYLARSEGGALTASTKKLCRYSRQHCGVDHKLTTRTVTITRRNDPLSCDHYRDPTKLLTTRRRSTGKAASASLCATAQPTRDSGGLSPTGGKDRRCRSRCDAGEVSTSRPLPSGPRPHTASRRSAGCNPGPSGSVWPRLSASRLPRSPSSSRGAPAGYRTHPNSGCSRRCSTRSPGPTATPGS